MPVKRPGRLAVTVTTVGIAFDAGTVARRTHHRATESNGTEWEWFAAGLAANAWLDGLGPVSAAALAVLRHSLRMS